jgi:dipeptidase
MIKNVTSSSHHLYAAGGSSLPYVSSNMSNPMQGMVRINGSEMEVFDGTAWIKIYMSDANVGLSGPANSAIDWAIQRMEEEKEWKKLAENNQAVKIALENLNKAREQLSITAKLAREYDTETTS